MVEFIPFWCSDSTMDNVFGSEDIIYFGCLVDCFEARPLPIVYLQKSVKAIVFTEHINFHIFEVFLIGQCVRVLLTLFS